MAEHLTEIVFNKDSKMQVDPFWLRDHCKCKNCYNFTTFQRKVNILNIPDDIAVQSYECSNDGLISIIWSDNHKSNYPLEFFEKYNFKNYKEVGDPEKPILWDEKEIQGKPAHVNYQEYLSSVEVTKQLVKSLVNYGVAFVENVPANSLETEFVVRKVFPIQRTLFGEMWTFSDNMDHSDTAYTKGFLGPHNDNTYFNDASGLQILHCLFHNGNEGETFLVDGFKVCEKIRRTSPDVFERLCTTMVPDEYIEEGKNHKYVAPIIQTNPITGKLEQIRYNLYDRAPMDTIPMNEMKQFYKDLKELTREMENRENQWWFKLHPGTVMFFDNWRVLHARNGYTGKRVMSGCYVSRTEYLSAARVMGFIR